jgi:hypothetical protein
VRVGGAANFVPMGRRSQYTSAELDFFKSSWAGPGGTNIDSILNGGGVATAATVAGGTVNAFNNNITAGNSPFAVDAFNAMTLDAFWAAKWKGFSFYNEWWYRDLSDFRGEKVGQVTLPILYSTTNANGGSAAALFPKKNLTDMGMAAQAGYFIIPGKLEIAGRYDLVSGNSGDISGDYTHGTVSATSLGILNSKLSTGLQNVLPAGTTFEQVNGAFTHYHTSQEITGGINWYFWRQQLKWQTDLGVYKGGNPAANGSSPAGYIPGVDGWLLRSQIQISF